MLAVVEVLDCGVSALPGAHLRRLIFCLGVDDRSTFKYLMSVSSEVVYDYLSKGILYCSKPQPGR